MSKLHKDNAGYIGVSMEETQDPFWSYNKLALPLDSSITTDLSTPSKTLTNNGATWQTAVSKFYGGATQFTSGNRITCPDSDDWNLGRVFTIEFWAYRVNATRGHIVGQYDYPNNNLNSWSVELDGANTSFGTNKIGYGFLNGGSTYSYWITDYAGYNRWDHFAVVRDGGEVSFYINGIIQPITASSNTTLEPPNIALSLSVGGEQTGDYGFSGYLQDLKIYKGIAKYTTSFPVPIRSLAQTARRYPSGMHVLS